MIYREAIVLNVIPFQDSHQIVTLFMHDRGLCRAIGYRARAPKSPLFGILSPLNHIEVLFRPSSSDLLKIESGSLINAHLMMRKSYERLQLACQMVTQVTKTQLPHKPAPLLFELVKNYLTLMQEAGSPEAIFASFQLKLLRHEGLIAIANSCALCGQEPKVISIDEGRTVCASHTKDHSLTEEETAYFYALALATSMKFLRAIEIPATLPGKVDRLFLELMQEVL